MYEQPKMLDLENISRINTGKEEVLWIDVGAGAALGAFDYARRNANVIVYAFEPNIDLIARLFAQLPNFIVIPMAVAEHNGFTSFHLSASAPSSSLLAYNEKGVAMHQAPPGVVHQTKAKVMVPCIRLDMFLDAMRIDRVHFLQIDAQGYDYHVVKSLGDRIKDVDKIQLEVQTMKVPLYLNAPDKATIINYLEQKGFTLVEVQQQSEGQEELLVFDRRLG